MAVSEKTTTLQARLEPEAKRLIERAAKLRQVGLSDYVRLVLVPMARREVQQVERQNLELAPHEQLEFWNALQAEPRLTRAQKKLARMMRGES